MKSRISPSVYLVQRSGLLTTFRLETRVHPTVVLLRRLHPSYVMHACRSPPLVNAACGVASLQLYLKNFPARLHHCPPYDQGHCSLWYTDSRQSCSMASLLVLVDVAAVTSAMLTDATCQVRSGQALLSEEVLYIIAFVWQTACSCAC